MADCVGEKLRPTAPPSPSHASFQHNRDHGYHHDNFIMKMIMIMVIIMKMIMMMVINKIIMTMKSEKGNRPKRSRDRRCKSNREDYGEKSGEEREYCRSTHPSCFVLKTANHQCDQSIMLYDETVYIEMSTTTGRKVSLWQAEDRFLRLL